MTYRLTHARLLASNFKACFVFYRDVLKLDVVWGDENGPYADFLAGDFKIALFDRRLMADVVGTSGQPSKAECQDRMALILAVENVDEAYRDLKDKDVAFVTEPTDRTGWGIRAAHFRDPDGNLLEINHDL